MASILVIDDDKTIRSNLREILEMEGHEVVALGSGEEALTYISKELPDIILSDLRLPGIDGLSLLEQVKKRFDEVEVVIITDYADVATAVRAIKLGARDYIKKPFDLDEISLIINKVVTAKKIDEHLAYLQEEERERLGFGEIVGTSRAMKDVFRFVRQVADSPGATVLIRGEIGTGKELVARAIHYNSDRAKKPFIEVNCSTFQETLLEAELFGHEAGAFTGARQRKKGLVEIAHEGSFFLDEIGDMTLGLQAKVLKVIEDQVFHRVGGTKQISVDVRIISATSRDLESYVGDGKFREDLYYRLNVARVELPPLRKRGEDIILLAEHFLTLFNTEFKRSIKGIMPEVKDVLMGHYWPGNVRELKNVIERAVLFEKGDYLSPENVRIFSGKSLLGTESKSAPFGIDNLEIPSEGISLEEVNRTLIKNALTAAGGNQTQAAKLLGISRETIKYRMRKFGLK